MLRFFALWDDSESELGETLPVTIHYFLVNDTVEIREDHKPNSGRFPFPVLMQRLRIPKKMKPGHGKTKLLQVVRYNLVQKHSGVEP